VRKTTSFCSGGSYFLVGLLDDSERKKLPDVGMIDSEVIVEHEYLLGGDCWMQLKDKVSHVR
jgi:hypothetical protein